MINHNELLDNLLDGKITVTYNGKDFINNFIEGDIFQVWEVLASKKTKYPLIWLQSGYRVTENNLPGNNVKTLNDCNFYLITKGDLHDFNEKRYLDTYKSILYPMLEKFKKLCYDSKGVVMADEYSYITFPFNDIEELQKKEAKNRPQKSTLSDIWDALYLTTDLSIKEGCYPQFKIKI